MDRSFFIPAGATRITDKATGAEAYLYNKKTGEPCAMVFAPKGKKPAWRYYFTKMETREKRITEFFASIRARAESKCGSPCRSCTPAQA
jgi:hypothetical protein